MKPARKHLFGTAVGTACISLMAGAAYAATSQFCVKCTDPDQTYLCSVETPNANPSAQGLQLYCIVRTSKEGGHRSCAVDTSSAANCAGQLRTYTFQTPQIPQNARNALNRLRGSQQDSVPDDSLSPQPGGEPKTLIDLTKRSFGASKEGLKNAGEAVGNATGTTTEKVGSAARGVGKGVAKAAGKVGSATKKTGHAVGSAAKTAWDCVKSLFKDCSSSEQEN